MNFYAVAAGLLTLAAAVAVAITGSYMPSAVLDPILPAPLCGRFTRRGRYLPDLEAHRKHDEAVLFAAHPADFHVWVGTADGQVCSFCQRVRDWTEPKPEPRAEEYPLWLTLPDTTEVAP